MLIEWVAAVLILGADGAIDRTEIRAPDAQACLAERERTYAEARAKTREPGTGILLGGCHEDLPAGADSRAWYR